MIKKILIFRHFLFWTSLVIIPDLHSETTSLRVPGEKDLFPAYQYNCQGHKPGDLTKTLRMLTSEFQANIIGGDTLKAGKNLRFILPVIEEPGIDSLALSDSYYYIGVYYLLWGNSSEAIKWLKRSLLIREFMHVHDMIYAKCIYNLGVAYNKSGDYAKLKYYTLKSLEIEKKLAGETNPLLLTGYSTLITALLGLKEYDEAIEYGNIAQKIAKDQQDINAEMADIYTNLGICHARLSDYSKAAIYLEKSETFYRNGILPKDEKYINLINSLAVTYGYLGLMDKSEEYFRNGIELARSFNSVLSFNFINTRAVFLANSGNTGAGEKLLTEALTDARTIFGARSDDYIAVLRYYASYLRGFSGNPEKSLLLYEECADYVNNYSENLPLREAVMLGYAQSLTRNGDSEKALAIIQQLLFEGSGTDAGGSLLINPAIGQITPDQESLNILKAKYRALGGMHERTGEFKYLLAGAETSEVIISVLEQIRINISEEESRLVLGDRFRDYYLFAIHDFNRCFSETGDNRFKEKAFEYCEKTKVAGLLASTRELKASQLQIPSDIAGLERKLQNEISFYNSRILSEKDKKDPDFSLIDEWNESVFSAVGKRDSLISLFESQYPEYYLIKYNTRVIKPSEITNIAGRNINYLNYVTSDSFLYVFVINRKHQKLLTLPVDSAFYNNIKEFRHLLSVPSVYNDARADYMNFRKIGDDLYKILFEPVRQYLISDKLLISPDNIISYIPFEAIPGPSAKSEGNFSYSELRYLINDFRISYTYSATFMAESLNNRYSLFNKTIAFAPIYNHSVDIDSLMSARKLGKGIIHNLPYAREEAEFVTNLTAGRLYAGADARESVYKEEAGNYDIIHLAMHTLLNDQFPMHSKMMFYPETGDNEDGLLNTFEVYGIPLKARMVVLSSCNTGTGFLHQGEGILSLARGFAYSGSQSVLLSMWEIEDRSGADIVKNYYRYLKKGNSKSSALKKARAKYLKKADQLRSHPYFWSAYVIYGNNAPVYYLKQLLLLLLLPGFIISLGLVLYYGKLK